MRITQEHDELVCFQSLNGERYLCDIFLKPEDNKFIDTTQKKIQIVVFIAVF